MPSDIRNFFGGKGSQPSQKTPVEKEEVKKPKGRAPKKTTVIEDSDDDVVITKAAPKKAATPKKSARLQSPKGTATTTSDYFEASNKPRRSELVSRKPPTSATKDATTTKTTTPKSAKTAPKPAVNGRNTSKRTKSQVTYSLTKEEEDCADLDNDDDIYSAQFTKKGKEGDDYVEHDSDEDEIPQARAKSYKRGQQTKPVEDPDMHPKEDTDVDMKDLEDDLDGDMIVVEEKPVKPAKTAKTASNTLKKRKTPEPESEEEDEDEAPAKRKARKASTTPKAPAKKRAKKESPTENAAIQAIFDSIPQVDAPKAPPRDPSKKFNYATFAANHSAGTAVGGSIEMPSGEPNCLAGLNFVFTGVLQSLQREEGQALVKQYGGKIQNAASSKTNFVVLGSDAGPKKLEVIAQHQIRTVNEEGLFELIRRLPANGGDGSAATAYEEKQKQERAKIQRAAAEIDAEEKKRVAENRKVKAAVAASGGDKAPRNSSATQGPDNQLWTVKYAPTQMNQICGNKGQVEKLQEWLRAFPKNQRHKFKMAGRNGSGVYRAVMISGPPGIGKTTAAHLVANLEGYDVVESNASDTRSKKLTEESLRGVLSTTSLMGYFAGDGKKLEAGKKKLVMIMDEVDGMSAGDRGGVGALAALCKKSEVPMILICNDRKLPKMKPFDFCTFDLPFRRPTTDQIRARISTIAFREKLNLAAPVVNALIEGTHADIRQVVNMLSTAKLDQPEMDFEAGKNMSKAWEKHVILKPWDITSKILGGGMFASSSRSTLNDKVELYFNDFEFSPLMLQENYLGTSPMLANEFTGRQKSLKTLELVERAAASISDGDLVDRMIHGSQQQWSLMPTHAIFSFVRPASFVAGSMVGHSTRFTTWLGQNSKQTKLTRMVKEIQGHMRLRSSGDRHEIRQQYLPTLWTRLPKRLEVEGKEIVPDIIDLMDSYYLTKDDFDAICELGVGYMDMEKLSTDAQAKATFTRLYNGMSHPLPFIKASNIVAPKKTAKEKPDLEEAIEESDEGEPDVNDDAEIKEEEGDLTKDKYIKAPKKKKAPPAKGKKKAAAEDGEEKPAKPKKNAAKAKGKK